MLGGFRSRFLTLYRIVANGRFTSGNHVMRGYFKMDGRLIYLMGPSGSGKDSLIEAARAPLQAINCEVVRRVITRSAESVGEEAIGVSREEFGRRKDRGDFALCWHANGLDYGIPGVIDQWLKEGRDVLINGSRGHLAQALKRYPALLPILLTVKEDVLRARLLRRGREGARGRWRLRLDCAEMNCSRRTLQRVIRQSTDWTTQANCRSRWPI